jgi:hypothetical protein
MRWTVLHPTGSRTEYRLLRGGGDALMVEVTYSDDRGFDSFVECADCGCIEEAGRHHRDGCPHAEAHRVWCSQCRDRPPTVPAYTLFGSPEARALAVAWKMSLNTRGSHQ